MSRRPGRDAGALESASVPRWARATFVLLVGLSGGAMALQGDASLPVVAGASLGGALVGAALLWYLLALLG